MTIVGDRLRKAMLDRGVEQAQLAAAVRCTQGAISHILTGETLKSRFLPEIAEYLSVSLPWLRGDTDDVADSRLQETKLSDDERSRLALINKATPDQVKAIAGFISGNDIDTDIAAEQMELVSIQSIDLAYGMGISFTDIPIEISVLHFPKVWIESITSSPPSLLTWGRGRGDSMMPTINDYDLVLLDRSQTTIREQDAIWAFTEGDTGSIKRLRLRNDRVTILSDNPSVPPDEVHVSEIRIVGRVIFIGRRT